MGRTFFHCPGPGPCSPVCASPRPLPPPPFPPHSTALRGPCAPGCPCPQPAGPREASRRERTGRQRPRPCCLVSTHRRQNHPPAPFTAGGGCSPFSSGMWPPRAQSKTQQASPAQNSCRQHVPHCPLPEGCVLCPQEPSPQSLWCRTPQHSGVLTTPGGLTLRPLHPGPQPPGPGHAAGVTEGAGVGRGRGRGDW